MKNVSIKPLVLCAMLLAASPWAGADLLEEELVQTDLITSDSEAAIEEAAELKKVLAEEKKKLNEQKALVRQKRKEAQKAKAKAETEIAANEKQITKTTNEMDKSVKELNNLIKKQEAMERKVKETQARLEKSEEALKKTKDELSKEKRDLEAIQEKHKKINQQANHTKKEVKDTKKLVAGMRLKIRNAYKQGKRSKVSHEKLIQVYQRSLEKSLKELEELKLLIEADQEYDKKLTEKSKGKHKGRTLSGLNQKREGVIAVSRCRLREFPSKKSSVLGSYSKGKKLDIRYHDNQWYSVIYGGEKAFASKICFG
ncbi:MAG: hypothetical protein KDD33_00625 [Bdellovibrionales bacterium]|nr:hypothetical protein [Bdellovibrionales bacterium]